MYPPRLPSRLMVLLIFVSNAAAAGSTITVTTTSPATPTSSSYTSDSDFESAMLTAHNFYRGEHNVSNISWNDTSATYASNWAKACVFQHSGGPTGENLAAGYPNATAAVDAWGLEGEKYNYNDPGFAEDTGHFTQVVWSNTTTVGCGQQDCNGADGTPGWYVVCEYYPPGNVEGDNNQYFVDNVKPQVKGQADDTVESGITGEGIRISVWGVMGWMVAAAVGFAL